MHGRINLKHASVMLMDPTPMGLSVLAQIFMGFGAGSLFKCGTLADAKRLVNRTEIDLAIVNDKLDETSGYEFVRWLRRQEGNTNSFASVILVSGHTRRSLVHQARDCGANFLVAKPVSARVLVERVVWVAREKRQFVETGDYAGPDRRFHEAGEGDNRGRRHDDLKPDAMADGGESSIEPRVSLP